jgi:hypothetical protein
VAGNERWTQRPLQVTSPKPILSWDPGKDRDGTRHYVMGPRDTACDRDSADQV